VLTASAMFLLPGVVIHELGHYLLCRLCGTRVQEVVFFDPVGPSGHVVHAVPRHLVQHAVIVGGPLVLNTALAFLLFRAAVTSAPPAFDNLLALMPLAAFQVLVLVTLGLSIALQAIPSLADATSLWQVAIDRLGAGQLLAVLAIPLAGGLILVNHLRRFWIDWIFALALAGLALWFPTESVGR